MSPVGRRLLAVTAVLMMLAVTAPLVSQESDASGELDGNFLVDYGNGRTKWVPLVTGATLSDTIASSLSGAGIAYDAGYTTIDGIAARTTGTGTDTGGSMSTPGNTGNTITCGWKAYVWNGTAWAVAADLSVSSGDSPVAVGYYPDGLLPASTPDNKTVWTALQGDSWNSANITTDTTTDKSGKAWSHVPTYNGSEPSSVYGGVLVAGGYVFIKYGTMSSSTQNNSIECRDIETGDLVWSFEYEPDGGDTSSAAICGQYVFVGGNNGMIYRIDWQTGPGNNNENVITYNGNAWDDESVKIPSQTIELPYQASYSVITESIVADAGTIYVKSCNGMIYCFDINLRLLWADQMDGPNYYSTSTVFDGYVFAGCYDGCLYIYDQSTGERITQQLLYRTTSFKGEVGAANAAQVFKDGDSQYTVFITCSDGLGMDSKYSTLNVFRFNGTTLSLVKDFKGLFGATGTYVTRYETDDYKGIVIPFNQGLYAVDEDGVYTLLSDTLSKTLTAHNAPQLVNNKVLYMTTYSTRHVFTLDLEDKSLEWIKSGASNYAMICPVVVGDLIIVPDDSGVIVYYGDSPEEYVPPETVSTGGGLWKTILIVAIVIVVLLAAAWLVLRFGFKIQHPFAEVKLRVMRYFFGEDYSHNTKSKRKVRAVLIFGILITVIVGLVSLCVGSETTLSLKEALSATASSISKGGRNLTYEEMLIYNQRLPRVLVAIVVGIGLSVAGAMYQAIIKNPLVEPYIMGVSSGAGTFAVAVMAFDFTFFGLFAAQSPFLTAFSAIVGGLLAFGLTMLMAIKTGGKSINYVLAGIVIGLVFSAIQSVLMISAGTKLASALSWLYGSFSTITWDKVWLVVVPVMALSIVPLIWAKEFNLVLLGEDQAQQMGLNAKRFDNLMLISASVLTAFCVAFCGIIGFVGLVIPHLSRMILGGDHRMMLPASMTFGGFLMVTADLLARMLLQGYELPVGAITTIIGVPVFAYLLIKRGRSYDE